METGLVLSLVIIGAAVTIYGLAAAYVEARRQVQEEKRRIDRTAGLAGEERDAMASVPDDVEHLEERNAAQDGWNRRFAVEGLTRATYGNMPQLHQFEAKRLVGELLSGARTNLLIAGVGVLLSTSGSVWDILRS